MTLKGWCEKAGIPFNTQCVPSVPSFIYPEGVWKQLFHLEDYIVSSVSGGSVWLVPRTGERSEPDKKA